MCSGGLLWCHSNFRGIFVKVFFLCPVACTLGLERDSKVKIFFVRCSRGFLSEVGNTLESDGKRDAHCAVYGFVIERCRGKGAVLYRFAG